MIFLMSRLKIVGNVVSRTIQVNGFVRSFYQFGRTTWKRHDVWIVTSKTAFAVLASPLTKLQVLSTFLYKVGCKVVPNSHISLKKLHFRLQIRFKAPYERSGN